ncbi:uncharacterized protein [Nicotiana sylvestris]|uniref:uncharacterized protein n=1 Tax=Nicotiana sylvestris TaxID=4096 RepID=UPI00388C5CDC
MEGMREGVREKYKIVQPQRIEVNPMPRFQNLKIVQPQISEKYKIVQPQQIEVNISMKPVYVTNKDFSEDNGPSSEKRKRGKTQMQSVNGRKDRKQIVLNENNQPIGPTNDYVNKLGSFLGTLARNATFCPLNVFDWRKPETKEDMCKKVAFSINFKCLEKVKNQLYKDHFAPYENNKLRTENMPVDVPDSQFRELLRYWNSDTYTGKKKETSEPPSSKDIFVATRKRKPDRAEMDRIQSTKETKDSCQSVDEFAFVMGPEHPGRLRLYGRGVTKTS